jgi:competence protein ComFC
VKLLDQLLRPIFPHVCEICGAAEAGPDDSFICGACRNSDRAIEPVEPPFCQKCGLWFQGAITTQFRCANCADLNLQFTYARSAAKFKGLTKEIIHRYKYSRQEWFEPFLSELLIEAALPDLREHPIDLIAPIPLHRRKRHSRGFNQAERLATRLSIAAAIPTANLLQRIIDTDSQAGLDRDDRMANVKNAFTFNGPLLAAKRVLVIDDVLTTGLTASACAVQLLKNGAASVRVWTVARGGLT